MKKQISILLAITILVSAAGCGKAVPTEPSGQTTPKTEDNQETVDSASGSSDSKKEEKQDAAAESDDGYEWPAEAEYTYESNGPDRIALRNMLSTSAVAEIPDQIDNQRIDWLYEFGFRNGDYIEEIIIPEGIEKIIDTEFYGYQKLKKITIPASVNEISNHQNGSDDEFWTNMAHVEDVVIAEGNLVYERDGGIIYRKDDNGSRTLVWYCRSNPEESFTVPEDVGIGAGAFACTDHLKVLDTHVFPETFIESSIEVINYAPETSGYIDINIHSDANREYHTALKEVNIAGAFESDLYSGTGLQHAVNLERVNMIENKESVSLDGVIYSLNDAGEPSALTLYPPTRPGESYEVPDTVTKISDEAFSGDELPYLKTISVKRGCSTEKAKLGKLEVIYRD